MCIKNNISGGDRSGIDTPKQTTTLLSPHTIQSLFQQGFQEYVVTHLLPLHYHKVAYHIMIRLTAALGGHRLYCTQGHLEGVWYHFCKDQYCPQYHIKTPFMGDER